MERLDIDRNLHKGREGGSRSWPKEGYRQNPAYANTEANARLIAAAPELFNALVATWIIIEGSEDFLAHIGHCTSKETGKTLHETVRDAIAKAEGRA